MIPGTVVIGSDFLQGSLLNSPFHTETVPPNPNYGSGVTWPFRKFGPPSTLHEPLKNNKAVRSPVSILVSYSSLMTSVIHVPFPVALQPFSLGLQVPSCICLVADSCHLPS